MAGTAVPTWLRAKPEPAADERRRSVRRAPLVSPAGVRVEALPFHVMAIHRQDWLDLAEAALEPNVFLDPDFALAAAQHLPAARRPLFVVARAFLAGRMRLVGLLALDSGGPNIVGLARAWTHDYAALGTPLLDARRAPEALDALLLWVAREMPRAGALALQDLRQEGPTALLLRRLAQSEGRQFRILETRQRAALRCADGANPAREDKERRRQWRRLGEQGRIETRVVRDPIDVRDELERFLALEAMGWKGERGTAMLSQVGSSAFARSAVRQMARRGAARIVLVTLDERPIAMGLLLGTAGALAFWKIAHDPAFARFSPGAQLTLRLSEAAAADPLVDLVDSCALEDHPMIDRLWPERIALVDVVTSLPRPNGAGAAAFRAGAAGESMRRRARGFAKQAFLTMTGRKKS
jgi:CelD/BcsL family acetyltransferase involved in cellulose biosynthesis